MDDDNDANLSGGGPSDAGDSNFTIANDSFEGPYSEFGGPSFEGDAGDRDLLASTETEGSSDNLYFEDEAGGSSQFENLSDCASYDGLYEVNAFSDEYDESVWMDTDSDSELYDPELFGEDEEGVVTLKTDEPTWLEEDAPPGIDVGKGRHEGQSYGDPTLSNDWKGIDFTTTMNTSYEQSVICDMYAHGQIDIPESLQDAEEPEFAASILPGKDSGTFEGERGNSAFVPHSEKAQAELARFGERAIVYQNNDPQFGPVTTHDSPYGLLACEVQIGHMTPDRQNPTWEYGERRPMGTSHDSNFDIGNFAQADNALVDRVIEEHPSLIQGKTSEEVANLRAEMAKNLESWRKSSELTWHECPDGVTMQLVPKAIHNACRHTGGVSVSGTLQAYGAW